MNHATEQQPPLLASIASVNTPGSVSHVGGARSSSRKPSAINQMLPATTNLAGLPGISSEILLVEVERLGQQVDFENDPEFTFQYYDILSLYTTAQKVVNLHKNPGLHVLCRDVGDPVVHRLADCMEVAEMVLDAACPLINSVVTTDLARKLYAAKVLAVRPISLTAALRGAVSAAGDSNRRRVLRAVQEFASSELKGRKYQLGDTLLVLAREGFAERHLGSSDFFGVRALYQPSAEDVDDGKKSSRSSTVLGLGDALMATSTPFDSEKPGPAGTNIAAPVRPSKKRSFRFMRGRTLDEKSPELVAGGRGGDALAHAAEQENTETRSSSKGGAAGRTLARAASTLLPRFLSMGGPAGAGDPDPAGGVSNAQTSSLSRPLLDGGETSQVVVDASKGDVTGVASETQQREASGDDQIDQEPEEVQHVHEDSLSEQCERQQPGAQATFTQKSVALFCGFNGKQRSSLVILFAMVSVVSTDTLPLLSACMAAAYALVLFDCMSKDQALGAVKLRTVLSIVGAFGLGEAIGQTKVALFIAQNITFALSPFGETGLLFGIFLVTVLLGIVFHATAVVILIFPVCLDTAQSLHVSVHRAVCVLMIGAGCQMLSPVSYQTNLMAFSAGGYTFYDFPKLGMPLVVLIALVTIPATMFFIE
ncbi:unnamed protein product [Amoebophrya sp. A25]|nr:unnamed protein product [Amoebophrya sp. A25]|eukprot:GSA25T00000981001.1